MKRTAILAVWLFIAPTCVFAQQAFTLKGRVMSADGKGLEGATVYLNRGTDSSVIKTALTDSIGNYSFVNLKANSYGLLISMVGYDAYKIGMVRLSGDSTLATASLHPKDVTLKAASVVHQKPLVEHLIDRVVINPDALIANSGTTVLDVLEKSPGVQVDPNGDIKLQGMSGATVFIDDRPTYLSGPDLQNYLRSMPSSMIDRIELMTNPPARYDAAGTGGVINIRIKRTRDTGLNGTLNLSYGQGVYGSSNNSVSLNFRQNKLNVALTTSYLINNNFNNAGIFRQFDSTVTALSPAFSQKSYTKRQSHSYNTRLTIDYYATDKTTLGIGFTGLLTPGHSNTTDTSRLTEISGYPDSTIVAQNYEKRKFKNGGINLNYRRQIDKKGKELTADLDYITYQAQRDQQFANSSLYPDGKLYYYDVVTGHLPSNIQIYSAKMDYTHPLSKAMKLSGGLKSSYTKTDNTADYFNTVNQVTTPDYDETNHFIYRENINAAYVNASGTFKKLSVQAGLRYENTVSKGHQLGNPEKPDSSFQRNYNSLFPTLYIQYQVDTAGEVEIGFNYGRRISRPYYADLNPFLSPLDKFTYNTGNPYLLPSYSNRFEVYYNGKHIYADLFYSYVKDKVDGLIQIVNGYYYNRPGNIGNTYTTGLDFEYVNNLGKWCKFHLFSRLYEQETITSFYTGRLDTKGVGYYIRPVFTFNPGKKWTLQADGYYQSKLKNEQFVDADKKQVNFAVSKQFSAVTLKLAASDIFRSLRTDWTIGYLAGTQAASYRSNIDSRTVVLSLSYRFGKTIKNQRKHEANGAQSEQNRVRN